MKNGTIPYRFRFGVTGHRTLPDTAPLRSCVEAILGSRYKEALTLEAGKELSRAIHTPIAFTVISPLAEGADRMVANAVIENGGTLEVVLPMQQEEYEKDFSSAASRSEFADLLKQARRVTVSEIDGNPTAADFRKKAYLRAGQQTVECCDILIALWDGEPSHGTGGTAEIIAFALQRKKPVFIVSTTQPGVLELKNGGTLEADTLTQLENFNAFGINDMKMEQFQAEVFAEIFPAPAANNIPSEVKQAVAKHLIPSYCRAEKIAIHFQAHYLKAGFLGYCFATLSALLMAIAVVFVAHPLLSIPLYIGEVLLLVSLYLMIHRAKHGGVHSLWLGNRALAERLRTAFYFAACGESPAAATEARSLYRHSHTWVNYACNEMFSQLPCFASPQQSLRQYRDFVDACWLNGQIDYHKRNADRRTNRNRQLEKGGLVCFASAIGVSIVHLAFAAMAANGHHAEGGMLLLEHVLSVVAIILPAAGAAVGGYRSLLELSRIAARSTSTADRLLELKARPLTADFSLRNYLQMIEEVMLIESEDWLALMKHADLERVA